MRTLSESASKALLAAHGVPVAPEHLATDPDDAAAAATRLGGGPMAVKLCGERIAHKTERGLVRLGVTGADAVRLAAAELLAGARPEDEATGVLVAPMIRGSRELIAGLVVDPQFGRAVMLGVGGVLAEAVADVVFRLVPITPLDAREMIEDLATQKLLGPFRGEPAVDRDALGAVLVGLSELAGARPDVVSVDVNPLIVHEGRPVAVDGLVEVSP